MTGAHHHTPLQRQALAAPRGHQLQRESGPAGGWRLAGRAVRPGAALRLQLVVDTTYVRGHQRGDQVPTAVVWLPVTVTSVSEELAHALPAPAPLCRLPDGSYLAFRLALRGGAGPLPLVAHRRLHLAWPSRDTAQATLVPHRAARAVEGRR